MKKFFNSAILIGILLILVGIVLTIITALVSTQNTEIIGGADFPTLLYKLSYYRWRNSFCFTITRFGIAILVYGIIVKIFNKTEKENCSIKSSLLALGESASLACCLYCFSAAIRTHITEKTLTNICGEIGFFASLLIGSVFFVLYIIFYFKDKKYKRIIFDAIITILFFGAFLALGNNIYDLLSNIF